VPASQFTKKEDLGLQDIEGLPAHGVRETQTIAAENAGAGRETSVIDESWYSDDLRINLMIKHSDPRTGAVIMNVTQITAQSQIPLSLRFPRVISGYPLGNTQLSAREAHRIEIPGRVWQPPFGPAPVIVLPCNCISLPKGNSIFIVERGRNSVNDRSRRVGVFIGVKKKIRGIAVPASDQQAHVEGISAQNPMYLVPSIVLEL